MTKVRDMNAMRNSIIAKAKEREDMIRAETEKLRAAAISEIQRLQFMLNGMSRVLGCVLEQTGEMSFDMETELNPMHPGRPYIVEDTEDGRITWTAKLKPDGEKPAVLTLVPDKMPEHMLDLEAMERDGVESVPMIPAPESA